MNRKPSVPDSFAAGIAAVLLLGMASLPAGLVSAAVPTAGSTSIPTGSPAPVQGEDGQGAASTAGESGADDPAATPTAQDPAGVSVEEVRAAMAAAEAQRRERLEPDPAVGKDLLQKWGVQVIGISSTSEGYMLDFRFHVIDADKALPLFDHRIQPYVLTEKSNIKLPVPVAAKVGAFRPTNRGKNIVSGKTYYMVFANPDSHVKRGDKVSVIIGDFKAEHLTVN